jgi:aminodeoxyfutalosine synthase
VNFVLQRSELADLAAKVEAGERLSEADGLRLFETRDLNALGALADFANQRRNGRRASYIVNRYLNYSNYCILSCQFCAFSKKKRDADGFQLTAEQMCRRPARRSRSASPSCTSSAGCIRRCRSATTPASCAN